MTPIPRKKKKMLHLENVNLGITGEDARLGGKGELAFKCLY